MGALIVEDVEFAVDVKDRHAHPFLLDLDGGAHRDIAGIAEFDLRGHGSSGNLGPNSLTPGEPRSTLARSKTRHFARVCLGLIDHRHVRRSMCQLRRTAGRSPVSLGINYTGGLACCEKN